MHGAAGAARRDPAMAHGVNTVAGQVTSAAGGRVPRRRVRRSAHRLRHLASAPMGATTAHDLDIPLLDLEFEPDREVASATLRAAAGESWIARNPLGYSILHYDDVVAMLRDKRWHSATSKILEMSGITDPQYLGAAAHVDPVRRGRRAHPPAAPRRQGVLAARRRPPAPVHARGRRRARRRRRSRTGAPTSPSTSASRTRSPSSASCSARRRRTGSSSAAGRPTCCASSTATCRRTCRRSSPPRTSSTSTPAG